MSVRPRKSATAFGLRALGVYVLLVFPWPGAVELYSYAFRGVCNSAASAVFADARIRLDPADAPSGTANTELTLMNRANHAFVRKTLTPWRMGYLPAATTIAMLFALPIPIGRRCALVAWGAVAAHAFIAARLLILVAHGLNEPTPAATLSLGPTASRILANANAIFVETTTVAFVVPAIIWLIVTLATGAWPFGDAGHRAGKISSR